VTGGSGGGRGAGGAGTGLTDVGRRGPLREAPPEPKAEKNVSCTGTWRSSLTVVSVPDDEN